MKQTLLQRALKVEHRRKGLKRTVTNEHIELAIAWMKGEVTATQVCNVLGDKRATGNYLYSMSVFLREGYRRGILVEKK